MLLYISKILVNIIPEQLLNVSNWEKTDAAWFAYSTFISQNHGQSCVFVCELRELQLLCQGHKRHIYIWNKKLTLRKIKV